MQLKDIARRIEENIKGQTFCLCDATTTNTEDVSTLLKEAFQIESLQMENLIYSFTDIIQLDGNAILDNQSGAEVTVIFKNENVQDICCSIKAVMPLSWKMPLDSEKVFCLSGVERNFQKRIGIDELTGTISGTLCIAQLNFHATGEYDFAGKKWLLTFVQEVVSTIRTFLQAFDTCAHLGIPIEILPDVNINQLIMEYEGRGSSLWDKLIVDATTGCGLAITENLGIDDLGVVLQKRNTSYSFTLKGNLTIGTTALPVYLRMRNDSFDLGVDTSEEGCLLPSLLDVASLVGITDALSIFPKEVAERKSLKLIMFMLSVPYTLQKMNNFSITIATTEEWSFFGIPGVAIKDINLGLQLQSMSASTDYMFLLLGTISIMDFDICLGGIYSSVNGWTLRGGFPPGEELYLDKICISLAQMLGLDMAVTLPIPEILLYGVQIEFGLTSKKFAATAKTRVTVSTSTSILDKLFEIEAEITITSELKDNHRSYCGQFLGTLEIDESRFTVEYNFDNMTKNNRVIVNWAPIYEGEEITLTGILSYFGVQDIPQVVSDLDFGISGVTMNYNIDVKELSIKVESRQFDLVSAVVSDTDYEIDIRLKDNISLSMLPIIGTYLHLLDTLAIEHLELLASSKNHPELGTLAGAALLGKIYSELFVLQIYQSEGKKSVLATDGSSTGLTKWFKIGKSMGIFEFYRFGIGFINGSIAFLLDASLASKPIELGMMGLGLGVNLSSPKDISFYLSGLEIDFDNGTLAIGGAFMKSTLGEQESYDGKLLLKMGDLSLFAIGTYSGDSLLVYALLNKQLGGPPIFFVTGISAGFGYNMDMRIPSIDKLADFPLVSAALGNLDKQDMLKKLKENVSIKKGQTFLAAGVNFTSFEMIESFALLTVTFGNYTEVNLLGLSEVNIPPHLPKEVDPVAHAQLALKASFSPKDGLFSVMAKLTSESYILSKKCKITGGFAFYVWYSGEHAGDFVVTLGGYHPNYSKPVHYPNVPRLGFKWDVTSELNLSGDIYFALTPCALMAGGRLSAVYSSGSVSAWFVAKADFYIAWKPFFYDVNLFVGFGVSVKVKLLFVHTTIKMELAAGLHIWGPEFSGTARISLYIISFSINFGAGSPVSPSPLKWTEFTESFLPEQKKGNKNALCKEEKAATMPLSITLSDGQRGEDTVGQTTIPVVGAEWMEVLIKSAVPVTSIILNNICISLNKDMPAVGILPMGEEKKLQSCLNVILKHPTNQTLKWTCEPIYENLPGALWGLTKANEELIKGVATGIRIRPVEWDAVMFPKEGYIDLDKLSVYSSIERTFIWNPVWQLPTHNQKEAIEQFSQTVMDQDVCKKREDLIKSFWAVGFDLNPEVDLTKMAQEADNIFTEEMILGVMI